MSRRSECKCACGCGQHATFPSSWATGHEPGFPYASAELVESSVYELWRREVMVIDSVDQDWIMGLAKQIDGKGHGPCMVIERRTVVSLHVRYGG